MFAEIISLESNIIVWTDEVSTLNTSLSAAEDVNFSLNVENSTLQSNINSLISDTTSLNLIIDDLIIDVDNAYDYGYDNGNTDGFAAGVASVDITSDNDAVASAAYDAGFNDGVASVECDSNAGYESGYSDGVASVDVDAAYSQGYSDGVASVDITADNDSVYAVGYADGYSSGGAGVICDPNAGYGDGYSDGVASVQDELNSCQAALEECEENGVIAPISIDLLTGWNMIGFSLSTPQDIVASFDPIDDHIEIVKNNYGQTYWPEFGFNGIGDLIPGQGYQLRLTQDAMNFMFVPIEARIELTPTVPQWAIDMEVPLHPNDVRTLVRVINLSGQEVNPEFVKGEVLLYLYNDGTVEKKINQ